MTGLLLLNLGTPDAPTARAVRRYLAEFLSDPRVLDMNPIGRWLLLHGIILRFRPRQSAHAYAQIWDERGSPLLYHGRDLAAAVAERLGDGWCVALGMRYGAPSIREAMAELDAAGCDHLVVLPLFPHYASSSTGSALEVVYREAARRWNVPHISVVSPFYADDGFIDAFADVGRSIVGQVEPDHVLFSFHGLPERHVTKSDPGGDHCLVRDGCCDRIGPENRMCYRAQCSATARLLAAALGLDDADHTVCFQSRLGRIPWIQPYTDRVIDERAAAGDKRLVVFCPAFVADCLETLEEIGIRAREQFLGAGGDTLVMVPSLNSSPAWADAVAKLAADARVTAARKGGESGAADGAAADARETGGRASGA
jgi:ferrochelatase